MKAFCTKTAALACCLLLALSLAFSLPVSATGGNSGTREIPEWLEKIGWIINLPNLFTEYVCDELDRQYQQAFDQWVTMPDRVWQKQAAQFNDAILSRKAKYYTLSGGGTSGGRGGTVIAPSGGGGSSGGRGSAYASGNLAETAIVSRTVNNNYVLNIPTSIYNQTTNNYYNQYDIKNIYYNNTYNTYHFETTNHYNYYVTYAPTFVNITYLDSAGTLNNDSYFFQLPDGRNSWDLKAEEVFGMYFIYDAINYDTVVEDEATLALYHFERGLKDESAYSGSAAYNAGASHNYTEHPGFGAGLYWDGSAHELAFSGTGAGGTYEFMFFWTQPGTVSKDSTAFKFKNNGNLYSYSKFSQKTKPERQPLTHALDEANPKIHYHAQVGDRTSENKSDTYMTRWVYTYTYEVYYVAGYLLNVGGTGYIPVYEKVTVKETCEDWKSKDTKETNPYDLIQKWEVVSGVHVLATIDDAGKPHDLPVGTWHYFAVSGGVTYLDGLAADFKTGASEVLGVALALPAYGNYTMIDEFRVSSGTLYSGTYTPMADPFDTNKVLVLPEAGKDGDIAVKSSLAVGEMRVGGARPTYPIQGDVFINVEKSAGKHLVKSAQQYQAGGWVPVDAAIRVQGEWVHLKDYDLRSYTTEPGDVPTPPDPGGDDSSDPIGPEPDPGTDSWWEWVISGIGAVIKGIADLLGAVLGGLLSLLGKLVTGLAELIGGLFDALFSLVGFSTRFGEFMGSAFGFIPAEIIGVIVVGLSLAIILMIINFFR